VLRFVEATSAAVRRVTLEISKTLVFCSLSQRERVRVREIVEIFSNREHLPETVYV
jgi:hypothetical protein